MVHLCWPHHLTILTLLILGQLIFPACITLKKKTERCFSLYLAFYYPAFLAQSSSPNSHVLPLRAPCTTSYRLSCRVVIVYSSTFVYMLYAKLHTGMNGASQFFSTADHNSLLCVTWCYQNFYKPHMKARITSQLQGTQFFCFSHL